MQKTEIKMRAYAAKQGLIPARCDPPIVEKVIMRAAGVTKGIHHVGLTVPDMAATRAFFVETLGFEQIGAKPDYPAVFITDGACVISIWQAENPDIAFPFDRKNVIGLHHLALAVANEGALSVLYEKLLDSDGIDMEFAPEPVGTGPSKHMMCYIPGGIRVEFIAPAS